VVRGPAGLHGGEALVEGGGGHGVLLGVCGAGSGVDGLVRRGRRVPAGRWGASVGRCGAHSSSIMKPASRMPTRFVTCSSLVRPSPCGVIVLVSEMPSSASS